jgi:hypothetical protein
LTITVNPNHTLALTSAGATTTQSVCPNAAITNITYTVGGGATGAGATGLPSGVTGDFSGGIFTLSGTPTVSGTYNYSVTTTGNACTPVTLTGTITVYSLIDWANLQHPASGAICQGGTFDAYGQVYEPGVTPGAGAGANIEAQFGYHTANTDPSTWSNWTTAPYFGEVGNNDEYKYTFTPPSSGTFYYTFRYRINGCEWQYGGFNSGFWDGSTNVNGTLTVNPLPQGTLSANGPFWPTDLYFHVRHRAVHGRVQ